MTERYEVAFEILDAGFPASSWQRAYGDIVTNGAMEWSGLDWEWREFSWGLLFMVAFRSEAEYLAWRNMVSVTAAFDAVPDPINGLIFHRGWGGTSGSGEPRRGKPLTGAGGAEVPIPKELVQDDAIAEGARELAEDSEVRTAACA